jgi:hypothetical protein
MVDGATALLIIVAMAFMIVPELIIEFLFSRPADAKPAATE